MKSILFVCTGNICRSPSAEAVLRHQVDLEGHAAQFTIDSVGTHGYHIGEPPDHRADQAAIMRGISMSGIRARKLSAKDFDEFDLIIAMDRGHMKTLQKEKPSQSKAELKLFCDYLPNKGIKDVPDPYYGSDEGFELVLDMLEEGCANILKNKSF